MDLQKRLNIEDTYRTYTETRSKINETEFMISNVLRPKNHPVAGTEIKAFYNTK